MADGQQSLGAVTGDVVNSRVQSALDRLTEDGSETGLQVAVVANGELVVDAVSGVADPATRREVTPDTLFFAASTAKGVASCVAHALVERGELDYDLEMGQVWSEFGQHGKGAMTLRHVLLHTAGLPAPPPETTIADLCDWDRMCQMLAAESPWWDPGTRFGYHALTFGFLLGEIVRRATGHALWWWLRDLVSDPLGVADEVHFGVPERLLDRVARQMPAAQVGAAPVPGTPSDRVIPPAVRPDAAYANRGDVLIADIPSQGTMTARGVATVYSAMLGHVEGVELVSAPRRADLAAVHFEGRDEVMEMETSWAFGFSPHRPGGVSSRLGSTFGMVGMNGSAAYADIDSGVAVAIMRNVFDPHNMTVVGTIDRLVADAFPDPIPRDQPVKERR